jgi:hypothetical protein
MMAKSSSASRVNGWISPAGIPHSSLSSSSQSCDSSASWRATPSLETNSSSERAREASRTWAATEVPERSSCFPITRTSSLALGSLMNKRMTSPAKRFVRFLNSSAGRPVLPRFPLSVFPLSKFRLSGFFFGLELFSPPSRPLPISVFYFLLFAFRVSALCFLLLFSPCPTLCRQRCGRSC